MVFAAVEVGGVDEHVGELDVIQGPVSEGGDLHVELLTDPAHGGLGDPRRHTQSFDQVIDLAGGGAGHICGHDHRPQRPIHPTSRFEQRREEHTLTHLQNPQFNITSRGRQHTWTSSVPTVRPRISPLMRFGADRLRQLRIDQLLEGFLHQVTEQKPDIVTAKLGNKLSQSGIMALGHRGSPFESTRYELAEDSTVARSGHGPPPSYTTPRDVNELQISTPRANVHLQRRACTGGSRVLIDRSLEKARPNVA